MSGKKEFDCFLPPFEASPIYSMPRSAVGEKLDYWHDLIGTPAAHFQSLGEQAAIFIVDTASAWTHSDTDKAGNAYGRAAYGEPPGDRNGHGHACHGVAGAPKNEFGIIGVAPKALIIPVQGLNENGSGSSATIAEQIRYCADVDLGEYNDRIRIINCSFGSPVENTVLRQAFEYAVSKWCVPVVAAGNSGNQTNKENTLDWPGRWDDLCITAGSISRSGDRSYFSSFGPELAVMAYGENVYTLNHQQAYWSVSGTSFATPMVAGGVALIVSRFYDYFRNLGQKTKEEVEAHLKKYARDLGDPGEDKFFGAGLMYLPTYLFYKPSKTKQAMKEKLPIDQLKRGVTAAVNVSEIIIALFKDLSLQGAISQLSKVIFEIAFYRSVVENAAIIVAQAKDTDTGEAYELYEHFKLEFDIENDEQEERIERVLGALPKVYELVDRIIPAWKSAVAPGLSSIARAKAIGSVMEITGASVRELAEFAEDAGALFSNRRGDIPALTEAA